MKRSHSPILAGLALGLALAPLADAQTVYGVTNNPDIYLTEWAGPPSGPCLYPNGDVLNVFGVNIPFFCPTVNPLPHPPATPLGDVAIDKHKDIAYVTDGVVLSAHEATTGVPLFGIQIAGIYMPGPLTGLGFDTAAQTVWITDGQFVAEIAVPSCGVPGPLLTGPFLTPSPGRLLDLDWDPTTGTLYGVDDMGFLTNITTIGGIGATGVAPIAPTACLNALGTMVTGIAVDTGTGNAVNPGLALYATDGFNVFYLDPFGGPAAPQFYTPTNCYPVPLVAQPVSGLAFSARPITYGTGFDPSSSVWPRLGSTGQAVSPHPSGFTIELSSAVPTSPSWLLLDLCALCPAGTWLGGNPLYISFCFPFTPIGPLIVPAGGAISLPTGPIPPTFEGLSLYMQWVVDKPGPGWQVTNGLEMTFSLP